MSPAETLARVLPKFLREASLLDLETLLRGLALELNDRSVPETHVLLDYARLLDRHRAHLRAAEQS